MEGESEGGWSGEGLVDTTGPGLGPSEQAENCLGALGVREELLEVRNISPGTPPSVFFLGVPRKLFQQLQAPHLKIG